MRISLNALILLCISMPVSAADDAGVQAFKIIDEAVAAIDGQVVTQSQLEFEARVLLVNGGGVEAAFALLDEPALRAALNTMIDQRLATLEADKLEAYALDPGELEQAVTAFRARFKDEGRYRQFLQAHEADGNDVAAVLRRGLRAQRILESRVRLKAQVSPAEAARLAGGRADLKGLPIETVRSKLFSERYGALVKAELQQARKSTDVRLLGRWAVAAGARQ